MRPERSCPRATIRPNDSTPRGPSARTSWCDLVRQVGAGYYWKPFRRLNGLREKQRLARCFGYGVPSYERATASAKEHLALVAQQTIQPYKKKVTIKDGKKTYSVGFNECHYYPLPWPKALLEQYADNDFILKVTLSYFFEPNPGRAAAIDPQNYQAFEVRPQAFAGDRD